jgi:uncharacterized protein
VKVRIEDIPAEGLEVEFQDTSAKPEDLGPQVASIERPPHAKLRLTPSGRMILGRGGYDTVLRLVCSRCLEEMEYPFSGDLVLAFQAPPTGLPSEVELEEEDMDVSFLEGDEIDLAQAVREELSLGLPMAPLCGEDCPGLCPRCGQPLRNGACKCGPAPVDPRWAKLASLKETD